jgi:hypothetical protein
MVLIRVFIPVFIPENRIYTNPEKPPDPGNFKKADPDARDRIYSESDTGSVWLFRQAF